MRRKRSLRQPSAFHGRKMFADGVDFSDGRAGKHKGAISSDQIVQRNFIVDGIFDDGRASAADHENHQRVGGLSFQSLSNRFCRKYGFSIWSGMSAAKI